ncbi:sulfatase family protein [Oleiharenicola lentus]|uniref:sulfatase family protein n=1 Tax=Oleiharenicola lentus TaxID=2508720 RepID=UPI003F662A90
MNARFKGLTLALLLVATLAASAQTGKSAKPNIVIILADDLGYGDLGCYGATKVSTPKIDQLAKAGLRFTDAHSPSAVCSPTRYGLLTGLYPMRSPRFAGGGVIFHLDSLAIETQQLTLPKLLKAAGYATAAVGKWHLGFGRDEPDWNGELKPGPLEIGFDYYFGVPTVNSAQPEVFVENHRVVGLDSQDPLSFKSKRELVGGTAARYTHGHIDEQHAQKATEWLAKHHAAHPGQPFFLYFTPISIHSPIVAHPKFRKTSRAGARGDFIQEHDWVVGEVLDQLEQLGVADNTLVIYASDNGGSDGGRNASKFGHKMNGILRGEKADVFEGGQRVPMIVRWPGVTPAGTKSDQLFSLTDWLATVADITAQKLPEKKHFDSVSFSALLCGETIERPIRQDLVVQGLRFKTVAVRQGDWKLIPSQYVGGYLMIDGRRGEPAEYPERDPTQPAGHLYNLRTDLGETQNLYAQNPEKVKELANLLEAIRAQAPTY